MENDPMRSGYCRCTPVVDTQVEVNGEESVIETLTGALAGLEGVDQVDLPPLYEILDLEIIIDLIEDYEEGADPQPFVHFHFENWNVWVRADGRIRVCDGSTLGEPKPIFADVTRGSTPSSRAAASVD